MKAALRKYLRTVGYDLVGFKTFNGEPDPLMPWETDSEFLKVYEQIVPHTLVDRRRLYMLWQLASKTAGLDGSFAECGVYKGGTALLLSILKPKQKNLFLFDTFDGMPQTDPTKDHHKEGDFKDTTYESVKSLVSPFSNVIIKKGFFPATASGLENDTFSFAHCDMDIYQSVLDFCIFFYPRLVKGGILIFDDYGAATCPGAKDAVSEFCKSHNIYEIYLPTGQAIIVK